MRRFFTPSFRNPKLEIRATKPMANKHELSRAYSPGVAEACVEIKADPATAAGYAARGNLVSVVSNGTAELGLGPLASKPVMEGKDFLFRKSANIDCFEVNKMDPDELAEIVTRRRQLGLSRTLPLQPRGCSRTASLSPRDTEFGIRRISVRSI